MPPTVQLKSGKDKILETGHPWIFSGALSRQSEDARDGDTVDVLAADKSWIARGYLNSKSQIAVRIWTRNRDEQIDQAFVERRLREALLVRQRVGLIPESGAASESPTSAFRLVNAEADGFPGLIVDLYGRVCVTQFLTLGVERRRSEILDALQHLINPLAIVDRSDSDIRLKEGLEPVSGLARGTLPEGEWTIRENHLKFGVNLLEGQKTGFYLDQRLNRQTVAEYCRRLDRPDGWVLNCFSYTGGFGVAIAAVNPAVKILHLDESADALKLALHNHHLNGTHDRAETMTANAFQQLRRFRDERRQFDVMILDPPKFSAGQGHVQGACRGYKDLNLLGLKLLRPGGLLATFSCTGSVTRELFRKVIAAAAQDARRSVRILQDLGHGPDHPCLVSFPEGEYLKGMILQVSD